MPKNDLWMGTTYLFDFDSDSDFFAPRRVLRPHPSGGSPVSIWIIPKGAQNSPFGHASGMPNPPDASGRAGVFLQLISSPALTLRQNGDFFKGLILSQLPGSRIVCMPVRDLSFPARTLRAGFLEACTALPANLGSRLFQSATGTHGERLEGNNA